MTVTSYNKRKEKKKKKIIKQPADQITLSKWDRNSNNDSNSNSNSNTFLAPLQRGWGGAQGTN